MIITFTHGVTENTEMTHFYRISLYFQNITGTTVFEYLVFVGIT